MVKIGSVWKQFKPRKKFSPLSKDLAVDVAIAGGGLTGIQAAYLLARAGLKVAVLEKESLGADATAHTTAFITPIIDTPPQELILMRGRNEAKRVWQSGADALANIERTVNQENLDCGFSPVSAFVYANDLDQAVELQKQHTAALVLGFKNTLHRETAAGFRNAGFLEFKQQAKFHPLKYLYGLAKEAADLGVLIFEQTEVTEAKGRPGAIVVATKRHTVKAHYFINATYDPLGNPKETKFKKGMYVSYVLELRLPRGAVKEGLYWDTQSPYHYFRLDPENTFDRMILGGADHRAELKIAKGKNFAALKAYTKELLPEMKYHIVRQWTGPIMEPSDGLPLIGEYKPGHYLATAFSGNGMTYSMLAATMFRDLITSGKSEWQDLYDPKRVMGLRHLLYKGKDYLQELFGGALKTEIKYRDKEK